MLSTLIKVFYIFNPYLMATWPCAVVRGLASSCVVVHSSQLTRYNINFLTYVFIHHEFV